MILRFLLLVSTFFGCSSAFQNTKLLSTTKPYSPRKDTIINIRRYTSTVIFGANKDVSPPFNQKLEYREPTDYVNSKILTRRNTINTLLTINGISCLPHASAFASDNAITKAAVDPTTAPPFTVILIVQTNAKNDATSEIEIEVRPDWAPLASHRFRELVESGFYKDSRFFRVLPGYVAQFGISADPKLNKEWMFCEKNCRALPDEPRKEHNKRGTLSFASSGKNSRQTQVFINLGNNDGPPNFLDSQNFVPFARVVKGMDDTVKQINSEYGVLESVSGGLTGGVNQGKAAYYGAEYLDAIFPKLSIIRDAKII